MLFHVDSQTLIGLHGNPGWSSSSLGTCYFVSFPVDSFLTLAYYNSHRENYNGQFVKVNDLTK